MGREGGAAGASRAAGGQSATARAGDVVSGVHHADSIEATRGRRSELGPGVRGGTLRGMAEPVAAEPVAAQLQVSVVLPTYQRPAFLDRAIASVREQTISDWELLVVDDNPSDSDARRETEARMAHYGGDARIRYLVHDVNRGASAARNTGIDEARADVVAFLDDDDAWLPEKLERQIEVFRRVGDDVGAVFVGHRRVYASGTPDEDVVPPEDAGKLERLLEENRIGTTSSIACRRGALRSIGGFDPGLPASQDYDLYLRLATRYEIVRVPEVLLLSYRHGQGAIGDDPARKRVAMEAFYEKHRALFADHPRGHADHLAWMGQRMLRYGFVDEAKRYLSRSLRLAPWAPGRWLLLALCGLGETSRARLWRARRFMIGVIRRIR